MGAQSIDRLREWLDGQGTSAAFLTDPVSIGYLTGFHTNPHERLMALVVGPEGAILVVPGLEAQAAAAAANDVEVRAWKDGEDPWPVAARALGSLDGGRIGVEQDHLSLAAWLRLKGLAPAAQPVDVGAELRRLRLRKAPEELRLLEQAATVTDQIARRVMSELRAGRSELEVAGGLDVLIAAAGARPSFDTLVQSGSNSALPHARPSERRLQAGDLVLLDFGAAMHGYKADTTRMAVVGPPTPRQADVHAVVLAANKAAMAAVKPGATAGQVDHAARAVIESAGLGERFIHRVGHGLGLEAHEDPSLAPGGSLELEPGMVVTIEPGVYIPGWGGVRIEDVVVVTETGCDLLTNSPREFRVVS